MNHALIVLQFVACRRQLGLGFTNFIIKSTQTAAMSWIIDIHLVMFEVRELFPGEIQFVFGSLYCGAEFVRTRFHRLP